MDLVPTFTISGCELRQMRRPLVYVYRDAAGDALYVGLGAVGAMRPLNPSHHVISEVADDCRLDFYCCESREQAVALEKRLIRQLCPPYNCEWRPTKERAQWSATTGRELALQRRRTPWKSGAGIRQTGYGWQVYLKIRGRFYSKHFPPDTDRKIMARWREEKRKAVLTQERSRVLRACKAAVKRPWVAASV